MSGSTCTPSGCTTIRLTLAAKDGVRAPVVVLPPESASAEDIAAEVRRTALKRLPAPEDVARAVAFLCAADAITGQVLAVESGKLLG